MSSQNIQTLEPKRYSRITYQRREELIRLVEEQCFPISEAGKTLDIKLSTAKLIVSRYRTDGTIFQRRSQEPKPTKKKQEVQKLENSNTQQKFESKVQTPPTPSEIAFPQVQNARNGPEMTIPWVLWTPFTNYEGFGRFSPYFF